MARLYADENVPLPVIEELRRLGHDVLTIFEDGKANQRYPERELHGVFHVIEQPSVRPSRIFQVLQLSR